MVAADCAATPRARSFPITTAIVIAGRILLN
jgi:hypothetical protein